VLLVQQLPADPGFDVLLVAVTPVDVLVSDHSFARYSLVRSRVVGRPGDPFASFDLAVLGSAHVMFGLSC
jgi:hypothetical protein